MDAGQSHSECKVCGLWSYLRQCAATSRLLLPLVPRNCKLQNYCYSYALTATFPRCQTTMSIISSLRVNAYFAMMMQHTASYWLPLIGDDIWLLIQCKNSSRNTEVYLVQKVARFTAYLTVYNNSQNGCFRHCSLREHTLQVHTAGSKHHFFIPVLKIKVKVLMLKCMICRFDQGMPM